MTPRQQEIYNLLINRTPISDIGRQLEISRTRVNNIIADLLSLKAIRKKARGHYVSKVK